LDAGTVQETVADALPACAVTLAGAAGTVSACGVTMLLGNENALAPMELLAATVN
jgi:hypothetical protein